MLSHVAMTRARLFTLVDALESDMRRVLLDYVLDHLSEEEALGSSYERASQRQAVDRLGDDSPITNYLDLQESYDTLNRHRLALPSDLAQELRDNTGQINSLIPIRNRVMHGRPLNPDDPELTITICQSFITRYWATTSEVINRLSNDPTWEPINVTQDRQSDQVLHNLPLPEYDETGLIGRESDRENIIKHILRRREPIITIVGEGGIGKTALALDAAYKILDNPDSPYECILWVSLKTERLTARGVVSVADAVRDLTGAAKSLGRALDDGFAGGVTDLADALEGVQTLMIIDNLETVAGDEVTALYDSLPTCVTFLFTSRVGVGQIERRFPLEPLKSRDSSILFRHFAKFRGVKSLSSLSVKTISEVVKRLRNSPLAIRWYILSVEAGQEPRLALSSQSTLLDFCVRSVYEKMGNTSRLLLTMLFALDHEASFDELAVITDISIDQLRSSVHELIGGSMVILEVGSDRSMVSRVSLTESARNFLRTVTPPKSEIVNDALEKQREVRRSEELRRADESSRRLAPSVVRTRDNNDTPTAYLLRQALVVSRSESFAKALDLISRARELNPEYWEVDRVEAFLLSAKNYTNQSTAVYKNALMKARSDDDAEGIAVVSYYLAGHLSRAANAPDEALPFAKAAHGHFNISETAQQLGKILTWLGEFKDAQLYLEQALESATGKTKLITITSLVESWRRWAEKLLTQEHRPIDAAHKAYAGFSIGWREVRSGTFDRRLTESVLESVSLMVRCMNTRGMEKDSLLIQLNEAIKSVHSKIAIFEDCRHYTYFRRNLASFARSNQVSAEGRVILSDTSIQKAEDPFSNESANLPDNDHGEVCSWRGTYGFIRHPDFPRNVFFPGSVVSNMPGIGDDRNLVGVAVKFNVKDKSAERVRADWVELIQ
ncbi:MAG TPA: NB-ARC domain-containing protein [Amycolatopsis sp.]|jgi:tetratricopeptide (TPR) repeat protein